jgi:hypothetical protein
MRIDKGKSDLTVNERRELESEALRTPEIVQI